MGVLKSNGRIFSAGADLNSGSSAIHHRVRGRHILIPRGEMDILSIRDFQISEETTIIEHTKTGSGQTHENRLDFATKEKGRLVLVWCIGEDWSAYDCW